MAAIAEGIDSLPGFLSCKGNKVYRGSRSFDGVLVTRRGAYPLLAFLWLVILGTFSHRDSAALACTAASYAQLMGLLILSVKVRSSKSVAGLSAKTLVLFVLYYGFRLSSTVLKFAGGYSRLDATGAAASQVIDVLALLVVLHLLYAVHNTHRHSYQWEHDTLPLLPMVLPCILLGLYIRAEGRYSPERTFAKLLYSCFAISQHIDMVVMVPQLWMICEIGGKVDVLTCHYVAATVAANVMKLVWLWYCPEELQNRSLLVTVVGVEQVCKLLFSGDFVQHHYGTSWLHEPVAGRKSILHL